MNKNFQWLGIALLVVAVVAPGTYPTPALADGAAELDREADTALQKLYDQSPEARMLEKKAKGVLVFPSITKVGFLIGGQYGEGALRKNGKSVDYYNSVATSYGLQAGVQTFGYALFLMSDSALDYLNNSEGFEIGSGPSVVMVDKGMATSMTSTTLKDDIYAFTFDQKGLMAGLGLQGTKITKMTKP